MICLYHTMKYKHTRVCRVDYIKCTPECGCTHECVFCFSTNDTPGCVTSTPGCAFWQSSIIVRYFLVGWKSNPFNQLWIFYIFVFLSIYICVLFFNQFLKKEKKSSSQKEIFPKRISIGFFLFVFEI